MKNKIKLFSIFIILIISLFCFTGCQSTNKSDSFFNYSQFEQATFEYNVETNKTKVIFNATLTNGTIYNFNSFSVRLNLYSDSNIVNTETYNYDRGVKNGDSYTGYFNFYANGQIDSIEYVSWTANYSSFWETYKIWFIVSIILVSVAFIIYLVFMIIEDLELSDTFDAIVDFFEEHSWIAILWLIPLGGTIWGIISSHWVPVLIVIGAVVAFVLMGLIAHLIKYIIEECSYGGFGCGERQRNLEEDDDDEDFFDNQRENVCDYINEPEKLSLFTAQQLREYCKYNNLNGYSKLNKSKLIDLITSTDCSQKDTKKYNQSKVVNKKTNSLEELDKLIGLESVKIQLKRIRAILLKNKDSNEKLNLHMCFYGNPGTGKTVVARLMANIFYEAGVLPTNKLIETDRSGLCGQYVGQTAPLTHKKVKEAMGGVLFIDEAYTLCADSNGEDYGKEAIAALIKDMEDYKGKFCVILAGYKDEMEKMIALNPGFDSRINRKIDFPDYSIDEQLQIFNIMLAKKNYAITDDAKNKLLEVFEMQSTSKYFANARTVRNILDGLVEIQAVRTMEDDNPENDSERIIRVEDVEQYYNEQ
ncbi:MAG: AAA family ATPase [Clostridia bacterium]|nr:AAA family ATPase [Clostridia bacterium]